MLLLIVSNIACFLACEKIIDEWSELCSKIDDEWSDLCEKQRKGYISLFEQTEKDWQERIKAIMKEREKDGEL